MTKLTKRLLLIMAAGMCMAVILAPVALAAGPGSGMVQGAGSGGEGNSNQVQGAPSGNMGGSGSPGTSTGQTRNGKGQSGMPPSDRMANMTSPDGAVRPGMGGNITAGHHGPGDMNADNTTFPNPGPGGMMDFGNMTPPDGSGSPGMLGNGTMMRHGPANMSFDNRTSPGYGRGGMMAGNGTALSDGTGNGGQSGFDQALPLPDQSSNQAQQQSKDDAIADIIRQLQSLLSGGKK